MSGDEPPVARWAREHARQIAEAARAARERSEQIRVELELLEFRSKSEPTTFDPATDAALRASLSDPRPRDADDPPAP